MGLYADIILNSEYGKEATAVPDYIHLMTEEYIKYKKLFGTLIPLLDELGKSKFRKPPHIFRISAEQYLN